jgi:FRG domain
MEIKFKSVDHLCELVDELSTGWDSRWYRGAKLPEYKLLPTLLRESVLAKREGYISVEFRRRAKMRMPNIATSFEWLCAMQHHGIPTRLLDWTESLATALYFSIRPWADAKAAGVPVPTVWMLNPFCLSGLITVEDCKDIIPIGTSRVVAALSDIPFSDELDSTLQKYRSRIPVPVAPDLLFERIRAQNGTFTMHGTDTIALEEIDGLVSGKGLYKLVADRNYLTSIYTSLDFILPSSDAMFPDFDGIKEYII